MKNNKIQQEISISPTESYPIVKESFSCPNWECSSAVSITPMHECWYCKFSDFRNDFAEHQNTSVCRNPKNSYLRLTHNDIEAS